MADQNRRVANREHLPEGYQPERRGNKPSQSNLDPSNPPKGGSGVPLQPAKSDQKAKKES